MVIEWLKFRVAPEAREKFIQLDTDIYSQGLAKYPGYLGKEIWLDPQRPDEVVVVLHWQTRELWKSVPRDTVDIFEAEFLTGMGDDRYELIEEGEFQVRKFLR